MSQKAKCRILSVLFYLLTVSAFSQSYPTLKSGAPWDKNFRKPRPYYNDFAVPLNTSYYFELEGPASSDPVDLATVNIAVYQGANHLFNLVINGEIAPDCTGDIRQSGNWIIGFSDPILINVTTPHTLSPQTLYKTRVYASSKNGIAMENGYSEWSWTTESPRQDHQITFSMDANFQGDYTQWGGKFFTGFTNSGFCVSRAFRFEFEQFLMDEYRNKEFPHAWKGHCAGFGVMSGDASPDTWGIAKRANSVRSIATRHITAMSMHAPSQRELIVEDFFGHEQYLHHGNPMVSNRPVSADYAPGDVVLIADGTSYTTTTVIQVQDGYTTQSIIVADFVNPSGGWRDYNKNNLPATYPEDTPGLFPPGGLYLRTYSRESSDKLAYYWGRINMELDTQTSFDKRIIIRFHYESPDLNRYGKTQGLPKHLTEYWQAVYDITAHIIQRYGEQAKDWEWLFFGEPDWGGYPSPEGGSPLKEIQIAYDYGADAVIRAFEDKWGVEESYKALVGGPGWAALYPDRTHQWASFIAHCAPGNNQVANEIVLNACYNDPAMDGRRSTRTNTLCAANNGSGAPINFFATEGYGTSEDYANKMTAMTQLALDIDPIYYQNFPINNYWTNPNWVVFPDHAVQEALLSNGWYAGWLADIVGRRLRKAQEDPRFATGGYSHIMGWGSAMANFTSTADILGFLNVDDTDDGTTDRRVIYNYQIVHLVNMLSKMKTTGRQIAFPPAEFDSFTLGGVFFESDTPDEFIAIVYAHSVDDLQSRSKRSFQINLETSFAGMDWNNLRVKTWRIDKKHNSFNNFLIQYRNQNPYTPEQAANIQNAMALKTTSNTITAIPPDGLVVTPLYLESNGVNIVSFMKTEQSLNVEDFMLWQ